MKNKLLDWNKLKEEALSRLQENKELSGKDGALAPLAKILIETALESELSEHLKGESNKNRRNGKVKKSVKSDYGAIDIERSRDRKGTFNPKLIKKGQRTLGGALNNTVLTLWAKGMSYSDIKKYISDMYCMDISEGTLTNITDSIIPKVHEWQNRPLDSVYTILWLDAIHFKIKEEGKIISKAVYCVLGLNIKGEKELLGMYLGSTESSSYWLRILTELSNRGIKDILISCIDNLSGFKDAIETIYPKTEIQQCIIHQIRNSLKYISHKDKKPFISDLKSVYKSATKEQAEQNLLILSEKWVSKYPHVIKSWEKNWNELSSYYRYPEEIRKIIYTTNIIESFHSQLRKITKTKRVFSSDMSLQKLLYLVQKNITSKWTKPINNWERSLSQFSIIFGDRLKLDLNL